MKSNMVKSLLTSCVLFAVSASANSVLDMTSHEADDVEREVFLHENQFKGSEVPRAAYRNALGQAVFKTLPIQRNWLTQPPGQGWQFTQLGDFIDLNGDGLPDFIISYHEDTNGKPKYEATFINDGQYRWVMVACESNVNWPDRFAPCQ